MKLNNLQIKCENSCDALLWNEKGDNLFVSYYDRYENNKDIILKGSIEIYDFDIENNILKINQKIQNKGNGILHIAKWDENNIFIADTSGTINILRNEKNKWKIEYGLCEIYEKSMCLYLDYQKETNNLWYSCQNGNVTLAKIDGISKIKNIKTYKNGHNFEAWYICAFNQHNAISGGDDGKVFIWDERLDKPINKIDKFFDYGVTSIINCLNNNYNFIVGSFDESISIWDIRSNLKEPINHFKNLNGQIWRMRWNPNNNLNCNSKLLACAMMQSESAIYEINSSYDKLNLIYKHNSFAQLVYGIEWHPILKNTIVSCSHTDKLIEFYSF